jgi:heptosyltransferase-3
MGAGTPPMNILIVRTDRVGDVMLTTPISAALKKKFPDSRISWLVRSYTAPLLANNPDIDQVLVDDGQVSSSYLTETLQGEKFDVAITALPRWRSVWSLFRAGIPRRIGPASKLYAALLTDRLWQHRSRGERHEADYNLELLSPLGVPFERFPTRFVLTSKEKEHARDVLAGHRISFEKPLVILHPGSGGSSERWPLSHFMALGDRLQNGGCDVVVTAGPGENVQSIMIDQMHRIPVFIPAGSVALRPLGAILAQANLVVSNSTGPLHMAVALGVPTVSVFSPIPTCHPRRWGPYPDYVEKGGRHGVLVAPETGGRVAMDQVSVEQVWAECAKRLDRLNSTRTP